MHDLDEYVSIIKDAEVLGLDDPELQCVDHTVCDFYKERFALFASDKCSEAITLYQNRALNSDISMGTKLAIIKLGQAALSQCYENEA